MGASIHVPSIVTLFRALSHTSKTAAVTRLVRKCACGEEVDTQLSDCCQQRQTDYDMKQKVSCHGSHLCD